MLNHLSLFLSPFLPYSHLAVPKFISLSGLSCGIDLYLAVHVNTQINMQIKERGHFSAVCRIGREGIDSRNNFKGL